MAEWCRRPLLKVVVLWGLGLESLRLNLEFGLVAPLSKSSSHGFTSLGYAMFEIGPVEDMR